MESTTSFRWAILGLILLVQWSGAIAGQVVGPLAPLLQPDLNLTRAEVGMFSAATFAGAWSLLLVAGSLVDRFGIRYTMAIGQLIAGLLLLTMAVAGSVFQAAAVMFAVGMARSTVFPGSTKAILIWFPPSARATAMGLKQMGMPMAGILTAAVLPTVGLALGWRLAVAMVGVVIVAAGLATLAWYRDPERPGQAPAPRTGMRAGFGQVLHNRRLWAVSTVAFLFVISQLGLITYLVLYFNEVVLVTAVPDPRARIVAAGGYLAVCQAGGALGRVFWGVVSDRVFAGRRAAVLAVVGAISTAMSVAVSSLRPDLPSWLLVAIVFGYGLSGVGWNGVSHALISETVGRKHAGTGLGLALSVIEFGTVIGPPIYGLVVDVTGTYQTAWLLLGCLSAIGTVVAILVARGERQARELAAA